MKINHRRFDQKKILIVSDDPSVHEMMNRAPVGEDCAVLSASSGTEAFEIAVAVCIGLVVLDLSLPTKNGWDALEELKAKNPLLSVIIITAKSDGSFSALSSGVGVLLKKPLHFVKLFETVSYLLTESVEARLERIAGKRAAFHYLPAKQNALL